MPRIFDYYGARDSNRKRISELISQATGIEFEYRESSYIGTYYKARGQERGQAVEVLSNELEDKDGISLRWPEWAEYKTIVNSMDTSIPEGDSTEPPSGFIDDLREKLSGVEELVFLQRYRSKRLVWPGRPIEPGVERPPGTRRR
jgi:hypothetical protein